MKSYIVIGLGRFGGALARQLCTLGAEVLAMDRRSDLVQQLANDVTHAVVGAGINTIGSPGPPSSPGRRPLFRGCGCCKRKPRRASRRGHDRRAA